MRLQTIYGTKFLDQFPSDLDVDLAKQEWGPEIERLDDLEIYTRLQDAKKMMATEPDYRWPNIGLIFGKAASSAAHKPFQQRKRTDAPLDKESALARSQQLRAELGL